MGLLFTFRNQLPRHKRAFEIFELSIMVTCRENYSTLLMWRVCLCLSGESAIRSGALADFNQSQEIMIHRD